MSVHARLLLVATLLLMGCGRSEPPATMKVSLTHETPGGEYVLCAHVTPDGEFEVSSFPGGNRSLSLSGSVTKQAESYDVLVHYQFHDAALEHDLVETGGEGLVRIEVNTQVGLTENEWLQIGGMGNEKIAIRIGQ